MTYDLAVTETGPMKKNQKVIFTGSNKCTAWNDLLVIDFNNVLGNSSGESITSEHKRTGKFININMEKDRDRDGVSVTFAILYINILYTYLYVCIIVYTYDITNVLAM